MNKERKFDSLNAFNITAISWQSGRSVDHTYRNRLECGCPKCRETKGSPVRLKIDIKPRTPKHMLGRLQRTVRFESSRSLISDSGKGALAKYKLYIGQFFLRGVAQQYFQQKCDDRHRLAPWIELC